MSHLQPQLLELAHGLDLLEPGGHEVLLQLGHLGLGARLQQGPQQLLGRAWNLRLAAGRLDSLQ